jgi:hypothetical protein
VLRCADYALSQAKRHPNNKNSLPAPLSGNPDLNLIKRDLPAAIRAADTAYFQPNVDCQSGELTGSKLGALASS